MIGNAESLGKHCPVSPRDQKSDTIADTVDVVIPMRNGASTVVATLATVTQQTLPPRRIIIVDDGSDDGGGELVRHHPLVDLIVTPPVGVSHARNVGIAASRAEFIAFLDCDDLWHPQKLMRQMEIARSNPETCAVTCDYSLVDGQRRSVANTFNKPRFRGRAFEEILGQNLRICGWSSSILARRDCLIHSGGFDENLRFAEDVDMSLRLARDHLFDYCPEVLTYVVENPRSVTRSLVSMEQRFELMLQCCSVVEKWLGDVDRTDRLAGNAAQLILAKAVRHRIGLRRLKDFRTELGKRAPKLASRIARTDGHFLFNLALFGILGAPELFGLWWRFRQRQRHLHKFENRRHVAGQSGSVVTIGSWSDLQRRCEVRSQVPFVRRFFPSRFVG